MTNRKKLKEFGFDPGFFSISSLRLDMISYNQIWYTNLNRTQKLEILTTDKLINLALIRSKFIKDQLIKINKNIEKLVNTEKFI